MYAGLEMYSAKMSLSTFGKVDCRFHTFSESRRIVLLISKCGGVVFVFFLNFTERSGSLKSLILCLLSCVSCMIFYATKNLCSHPWSSLVR